MNSISENVYINKLDNVVNKYNTYHSTIKMNAVDVKSSTYIDSSKEINDEDPKSKIGDIIRISKYKNIFVCTMFQICLHKKFLSLKKLNTLCLRHMLLGILKAKKLLERFAKKNCQKQIKKSLELKK